MKDRRKSLLSYWKRLRERARHGCNSIQNPPQAAIDQINTVTKILDIHVQSCVDRVIINSYAFFYEYLMYGSYALEDQALEIAAFPRQHICDNI